MPPSASLPLASSEPIPRAASRRAPARDLRGLVRDLLFLVILGSLSMAFLFQPFKVEGASMQPALADHERILVNKLIYQVRPVRREDIVVFWFPGDPHRSFVKRVIGLPGDQVEIREGGVYVNGEALREPHIPAAFREGEPFGPVRVREGHYFVLGDHRKVSNDSRAWGSVPQEMILGKVILKYWPLNRIGRIH